MQTTSNTFGVFFNDFLLFFSVLKIETIQSRLHVVLYCCIYVCGYMYINLAINYSFSGVCWVICH
jgi:hypothetical protein